MLQKLLIYFIENIYKKKNLTVQNILSGSVYYYSNTQIKCICSCLVNSDKSNMSIEFHKNIIYINLPPNSLIIIILYFYM